MNHMNYPFQPACQADRTNEHWAIIWWNDAEISTDPLTSETQAEQRKQTKDTYIKKEPVNYLHFIIKEWTDDGHMAQGGGESIYG